MKKHLFILSFSLFAILYCNYTQAQGLFTSLKITVVDDKGVPQSKSVIKLYNTLENYEANTNQILLKETNHRGIASFLNIEAINYFLRIENGTKNNSTGVYSIEVLAKNKLNEIIIIIKEDE